MPSVLAILTTVKDLSLVGSGDGSDDARLMRYMNLVYKEVWRETAEEYPNLLMEEASVLVTNGAGTLAAAPWVIKRVKDTSNNQILCPSTLMDVEECHPALSDTGKPNKYYISGMMGLRTFPLNSTTVLVRSIPLPVELTTATTESDIKIPPPFHDVLVWGTLVYSCMDERDKLIGMELNTAQSKYEIALNSFKQWLEFTQTQKMPRTEAVLGG